MVLFPNRGFKKRAPRAIKEIRKFAVKEMGTPDVRIDTRLNKAVWSKGIRSDDAPQHTKKNLSYFSRSFCLCTLTHFLHMYLITRKIVEQEAKLEEICCVAGTCHTGYAYVCPGSVTRTRTPPTNCTPWSHTFLSPHAKVNMFPADSIHLLKQ